MQGGRYRRGSGKTVNVVNVMGGEMSAVKRFGFERFVGSLSTNEPFSERRG